MSQINRQQIAALLRPGLHAIVKQPNMYPEIWREIYRTQKSNRYAEQEAQMQYLGTASIKPEGQPYASGYMKQSFMTSYIHKTVSIGFEITKEAIQDNLYQNDFPMKSVSLKHSLKDTKEILAANLLNNAFNPAYPIGDGEPVCSLNHPIDGGTYSNMLSIPTAFSEAALEQLIIMIRKFPTQSGLLANTMPEKLVIPMEQSFNAKRILGSTFRPGTALNDINVLNQDNVISKGIVVDPYLTSPTAYFLITNAPDGLKHFERQEVQIDTYCDFDTDSVKFKGTERYSFGITNPHAIAGSPGVVV